MAFRIRLFAVLASAVLTWFPATVSAQRTTTGTIVGKIVDSSGAVMPGVTVSLKSPEALGDFTAVTDSNGMYRVTNLPPATYDVRAELTGFQSVIRKAPVRLNAVTEVDFTLSVGAVSETVTVTAESPIVDPERAGLSVNINNQALTSVPVTTNRIISQPGMRATSRSARSTSGGEASQKSSPRRAASVTARSIAGWPCPSSAGPHAPIQST